MSKIKFSQLDSHNTELTFLKETETSNVVGGYGYLFHFPSSHLGSYFSSRYNINLEDFEHLSDGEVHHLDIDGAQYSFIGKESDNGNSYSYNYVLVSWCITKQRFYF